MSLKKTRLFFLLLFASVIANAGEIDPAYISPFKTRLNFKILLNQNDFRYSFTPLSSVLYTKRELSKAQINYGSYIPFSAGFAFNFMFGGFGYDFRFTKKYFNPSGKEVTDFKDFKLTLFGRKICIEAFYDRFNHNYFIRDEKLFAPLLNYDGDINAHHWGINMRVITNDSRFSYKAAFAQTEFQKKTAATFIALFGYDQNQLLRNNGLLLDTSTKKYYDNIQDLYKLKQQLWFVMPGFASNLVFQKFYFANSVYVGSGAQFNKLNSDTGLSKKVNLPFLSKARINIGINGKTVYAGIFANVDYARSSFQSLKTEYFNYKFGFFVGVRLIKQTKTKEERQEEKRKLKQDKNKRA